jgi:hypothetical protein
MADNDSQPLIEELRHNKDMANTQLGIIFKRWKGERNKSFLDWYEEEKKAEARVIVQMYSQDQQNMAKAIFGESLMEVGYLIPGFASSLMMSMKEKLKETGLKEENEINKAIANFLRSDVFENTSYIKISAVLYASMAQSAHEGRVNPPGGSFFTDVKILSTLLSYCDAMFVDNECRGLLQRKEARKILGPQNNIYSSSNKEEFMEYLKQIRKSATKEHLKAVEEVYGQGYEKPFNEIFKK